MQFIFFFTIILILLPLSISYLHRVSENMRKKLNSEEANAICCANHLACCKETEKSTNFEIRSLLTDCPNQQCTNYSNNHQVVVEKEGTKQQTEKLTNCVQKLLLSIKIISEGLPTDNSKYVIVDHVTDAVTLKKIRILNPYAIRIRQVPMMQIYDLIFERAINAEAKEMVLNKHNRNYRGCNIGAENPTCGLVEHDGKIVPYSTGFCCSCNEEKNQMMEQWPDRQLPEYHKNNNYDHYKHYGFIDHDGKMVYGDYQKRSDTSANYHRSDDTKKLSRQRRGGQSCDDINMDTLPESFHESTHCLTFSNLWYSVYQMKKPRIVHLLRIQIFQKYEDCHGSTHWIDLTKSKVLELGTNAPFCIDHDIISRYSSEDVENCDEALDYKNQKLLVPERRVADPQQFMIIPKKLIGGDGKTCNTAGVGYEAFYKQKKRCSLPKGSCLENQPQHLYQSDLKAENRGETGKYFLKFYGTLAESPVGYNSTGQMQYLKMLYTKKHISNLYFELNADLVTELKPNNFATITEVYTDGTNQNKARIVVKVTNSGLLYGIYYVRLSGCPLDVPASFNNIASKSVLIASQHQHIFNLYIEYPLPSYQFFCKIHVHNVNQELIAMRRIRIQALDRCICIWYCQCVCYLRDQGLKCTPMSLESFHAAGFQGGLPIATHLIESSYLDDLLVMFFQMFSFLILTLLIMGLIKALLGLCWLEIGLWGLDTILGTENVTPSTICENKECEYRENGITLPAQFCLNVIFFFIYPLALINVAIKKFCFSKYTIEEDECSCEERWVNYECDAECRKSSLDDKSKSNISMKYTTSEDKSIGGE